MPWGFSAETAERDWADLPKPDGWLGQPAVRAGCVYALDANSYCSRPGPGAVEGVEQLVRLLHPASFSES